MGFIDSIKSTFSKPYDSIGIAEARALLAGGAILMDVRSAAEWKAGHAPEAVHLELGQVVQRGRKVAHGNHIVTVCRSGMRSAKAARALSGQGLAVSNVKGGMSAWLRAGGRVVASGGAQGRIL